MTILDQMIEVARVAQARTYSPYSGYAVGACIQDELGNLWGGTNVENLSYGATLCAERVAVGAMIAGGGREIKACVVVTRDGGAPCGMCRQVLSEFTSHPAEVMVTMVSADGGQKSATLADLVPMNFVSDEVGRTVPPSETV